MLNEAIHVLITKNQTDQAMDLITAAENNNNNNNNNTNNTNNVRPNPSTYITLMKHFVKSDNEHTSSPEYLHSLLKRMNQHCHPTEAPAAAYNIILSSWANLADRSRGGRPEKAEQILGTMWNKYLHTRDHLLMPSRATYMGVMTTWARSRRGQKAAERVETLLEEMEAHSERHPSLGPVTAFLNVALTAWSNSRSPLLVDRCLDILRRMEKFAKAGRTELAPDTISFNIVIDALAQDSQIKRRKPYHHQQQQRKNQPQQFRNEWKAEELLNKMEQLSREDPGLWDCQPNSVSYNTVLKCWARSRDDEAVHRAEQILAHMETRFFNKLTDIRPDEASYSSVIQAWANSRDPNALQRSLDVLDQMETAFENGNIDAKPNTMVYNTIFNVMSKSKSSTAPTKAMELLETMKQKGITLDVYTYTSVIDVLAKAASASHTDTSIQLLHEMQSEYERTRRVSLKPNVRTYTSVINAIGRSKERPERTKEILASMKESGVEPDGICYNAAINAWGWSNANGKEIQAFGLLQEMIKSRNNKAKPDIITCNSVLDSCAFAFADTESERARVIDVATKTMNIFTSKAPKYGWPDQITYANMLLTVTRVMPMGDKRSELARAVFQKCAKAGHVTPLVIQRLRYAVEGEDLAELLGAGLVVNHGSKFVFDMKAFPQEWTRYAPKADNNRNRNVKRHWRSPASTKIELRQFTKEKKRVK